MSDTMPDAASLPLGRVEHRVPGRLRLRIDARRGDTAYFDRAVAALAAEPAIRSVRANARTASLLIEHAGDEAALLAHARAQHLFEVSSALGPVPRAPLPVPRGKAAGKPSPLQVAAVGFAGAGALQLLRGRVLGSATENLWNAYLLHAGSRQAGPSALLVALGLVQIARGELLGSASSLFLYAYRARQIARHQPAGIV